MALRFDPAWLRASRGAGLGYQVIDDKLVVSCLDDAWRSVPSVKRLLHKPWPPQDIASALRRLARAGDIEKRESPTLAPKLSHAPGTQRVIELYRRLQ